MCYKIIDQWVSIAANLIGESLGKRTQFYMSHNLNPTSESTVISFNKIHFGIMNH